MDGLVALIVLIVIGSLFSQSKKKKRGRSGPSAAASSKRTGKSKIPYAPVQERAQLKVKPQARPSKPNSSADVVAAIASVNDEAEGSISTQGNFSTQGESPEEHAVHQALIAVQEAMQHQEQEKLESLQNARLEELRTAVVMSEVLGKPVALRRRYRY